MKRPRILIVDDEVGAARLLKVNLESTGRYEVCVETRPLDALEAARHFQPHLAVLDVIMPQISGTSLAARLRAEPNLKAVAIIFLTAATPELINEEVKNGLAGFPCIGKPVSMEELLLHIERNLPRQEG